MTVPSRTNRHRCLNYWFMASTWRAIKKIRTGQCISILNQAVFSRSSPLQPEFLSGSANSLGLNLIISQRYSPAQNIQSTPAPPFSFGPFRTEFRIICNCFALVFYSIRNERIALKYLVNSPRTRYLGNRRYPSV